MSQAVAIVSGSDSAYFPLLAGLARSLRRNAGSLDFDLCIYDLGLTEAERAEITPHCRAIRDPGWVVDFAGRARIAAHYRLRVAKPFIPEHFPGYDAYLWLDADLWVQDAGVLALYLGQAGRGKLAVTVEYDRAYRSAYKRPKLLGWTHNHKHYRLGWGWRVADRFGRYPILNSGAFAMAAASPLWRDWQDNVRSGLERNWHPLIEQTALNLAAYRKYDQAAVLPAWCNWLCDAALPAVDTARALLVEPFPPHQPLGIVHLAGEFRKAEAAVLATVDGEALSTRLTFPEWTATRERLGAVPPHPAPAKARPSGLA